MQSLFWVPSAQLTFGDSVIQEEGKDIGEQPEDCQSYQNVLNVMKIPETHLSSARAIPICFYK